VSDSRNPLRSAEQLFEQSMLVPSLATSLNRLDSNVRARSSAQLKEAFSPYAADSGGFSIPLRRTLQWGAANGTKRRLCPADDHTTRCAVSRRKHQ